MVILKMNTTVKNPIRDIETSCDYCGNPIEICMCVCPIVEKLLLVNVVYMMLLLAVDKFYF